MLRQAGKKRTGRPRANIDDHVLARLYLSEKLSVRAIGEHLGVSHQTIARRIAEAKLPTRRWRFPGED